MPVIKEVLGRQIRFGGEKHTGWLPANAALPQATPVRIAVLNIRILETGANYILEWISQNTDDHGDTWHETIADAEDQASRAFGIQSNEWLAVERNTT